MVFCYYLFTDILSTNMNVGAAVRGTKLMIVDEDGRIVDTSNALSVCYRLYTYAHTCASTYTVHTHSGTKLMVADEALFMHTEHQHKHMHTPTRTRICMHALELQALCKLRAHTHAFCHQMSSVCIIQNSLRVLLQMEQLFGKGESADRAKLRKGQHQLVHMYATVSRAPPHKQQQFAWQEYVTNASERKMMPQPSSPLRPLQKAVLELSWAEASDAPDASTHFAA